MIGWLKSSFITVAIIIGAIATAAQANDESAPSPGGNSAPASASVTHPIDLMHVMAVYQSLDASPNDRGAAALQLGAYFAAKTCTKAGDFFVPINYFLLANGLGRVTAIGDLRDVLLSKTGQDGCLALGDLENYLDWASAKGDLSAAQLKEQKTGFVAFLSLCVQNNRAGLRLQAVRILCHMAATGDPDAVPAVLALVKDKDERVRAITLLRLAPLAKTRADIVNTLVSSLGDESVEVRWSAIIALTTSANAGSDQAVEGLLDRKKDKDPLVRAAALFALRGAARSGRPEALKALLNAASDDDPLVRQVVWDALGNAALPSSESLDQILQHASSPDEKLRANAMADLRYPGLTGLENALETLLGGAGDSSDLVREKAMEALGILARFGNGRAEAALISGTTDSDPFVGAAAIQQLALIAKDGNQVAVATLRQLAQSNNSTVNSVAKRGLIYATSVATETSNSALFEPVQSRAYPTLNKWILDDCQSTLTSSGNPSEATSEAALQPVVDVAAAGNPDAQEALLMWASDGPGTVRTAALQGLMKVANQKDVPNNFLVWVRDPDPAFRTLSLPLLGVVVTFRGAHSSEALAAIAANTKNSNEDVRNAALDELGSLTLNGDKTAQDVLLELTKSTDPDLCSDAMYRWAGLANVDTGILKSLESLASDPNSRTRVAALKALGNPALASNSEVVNLLISATQDPDERIRANAILSLEAAAAAGNPQALQIMGAFSHGHPPETVAALKALSAAVHQGNNSALWDVSQALSNADPKIRATAVAALADAPSSLNGQLLSLLTQAAQDNDENVRASAMNSLAQLYGRNYSAASALVLRGLGDASPAVRASALHGLVDTLHFSPELQNIENAIANTASDSSDQIRSSVFAALPKLRMMGYNTALVPLLSWNAEKSLCARLEAIHALRVLKGTSDNALPRTLVSRGLSDINCDVQVATMYALCAEACHGDQGFLNALVAKLKSDNQGCSEAAVDLLIAAGAFGRISKINPEILVFANDAASGRRRAALEILGSLAASDKSLSKVDYQVALDALLKDAGDKDAGVRAAALSRLGDVADTFQNHVVKAIVYATVDDVLEVRRASLRAINKLLSADDPKDPLQVLEYP